MRPDVVLVFAFGSEGSVPNIRLSHKAEVFGRTGVPIFTQRDLSVGEGTVFFAEDVLRTKEGWKEGQYISTLDIIRSFEYIVRDKGWRKVLILAAPQHIRRCLRDMRRSSSHPDVMRITSYRWTTPWIWYDVCSGQWWTRGPVRWHLREKILLALPWAIYAYFARGEFG